MCGRGIGGPYYYLTPHPPFPDRPIKNSVRTNSKIELIILSPAAAEQTTKGFSCQPRRCRLTAHLIDYRRLGYPHPPVPEIVHLRARHRVAYQTQVIAKT